MNIFRGILNRLLFLSTKRKLKTCGEKSLFEYKFEIEGEKYITIGSEVRAKPRFHLVAIGYHNGVDFKPQIVIGDRVSINYDVHIAAINRIVIGEDTLIASKVFITDHFHGDTRPETLQVPPSKRILISKGSVEIGKNVWIGEGTAIMPGVVIGDNCIIGANSVVTNDIPSFCIAAGVPARIIRQYNENKYFMKK